MTHFYIAARIRDTDLHVTLTFIENATADERSGTWEFYLNLLQNQLPFTGKFGSPIKVGLHDDIDAVKVVLNDMIHNMLCGSYRKTSRRSLNHFPDLLLHCTAKNTDVSKLVGDFEVDTIYAATTGANKAVVASLTQSIDL